MKVRIVYKSSLVLSAAVIIFTAIEHVHLYMTEYTDGLPNDLSFWPFVLFFIYELPKLALLIGAGLALFVSLCCVKFHLSENKTGIVLFVCAVITFLGYWVVRPPGAVIYLQGLKKWAEQEVDTKAIQNWLVSADGKYRDKGLMIYYKRNEFPEELPDYLVGFDPEFIWFEDSELDGSRTIRFGWGGSVSIWGFVVGEPGMKMPKHGRIDMYGGDVELISIVKPGVYVFFR